MKLGIIALFVAVGSIPALAQGKLVEGKFLIVKIPAPAGIVPAGNNVLFVHSINDFGAITGFVTGADNGPPIFGFLRSLDGTLIQLQDPATDGLFTAPYTINDFGTIVGVYFNVAANHDSGFIYNNGSFQNYDFPGVSGSGTYIEGINNYGVICGDTLDPQGFERAFVDDHGTLDTNFSIPGAVNISASSINDIGTVVGEYNYANSVIVHGFLRGTDGSMTPIDVPGAAFGGTLAHGINDAGWISGDFYDGKNHRHGFLRAPDGTFYQIDVPGAVTDVAAEGTSAEGLNNFGIVVGHYDPAGGGPEGGYAALLEQP